MLYHVHDLYIGRALAVYGEWSPGEMALYRHLLEPGDIVVEAGANIGALTVPIAQQVGPTGWVYAFEPQRMTYQVLNGNLALNNLTNVTAFHLALGAAQGMIHVPEFDLTKPNNFGALPLDPDGPPNMALATLDYFCELPRLDLLKMDVEGMELAILQGAEATVARCRPVIVAEVEHGERAADLIHWLVQREYVLYAHYPPLVVDPTLWPGVVSKNLLAIPAEQPQPTAEVSQKLTLIDLQE